MNLGCEYCKASASAPAAFTKQCAHCKQSFGICAHHATLGVHYHAQGAEDGPQALLDVCAKCGPWDRDKQDFTGSCGRGCLPRADPAAAITFPKPKPAAAETPYDPMELASLQAKSKSLGASSAPQLFAALADEHSRVVLASASRKHLRVMSWNIQDLGGGFKGPRSKAVLDAIALLIEKVDPDVCAVIEVLRKKMAAMNKKKPRAFSKFVRVTGKNKKKKAKPLAAASAAAAPMAPPAVPHPGLVEIEKIVAALNASATKKATWAYVTHPRREYTGGTTDASGSEGYAFIYKNDGDIAVEAATVGYVSLSKTGAAIGFPTPKHRRPMQAVFTFQNKLAARGKPWKLPIVAFHAPAQHTDAGRDPVPMQALAQLADISIVDGDPTAKSGVDFPEWLLAADLNVNFDYYDGESWEEDAAKLKQDAVYIRKAYDVLDKLGANLLLGNEIFPRLTTLKQVSHDFIIDDYKADDFIDAAEDVEIMPADALEPLIEMYLDDADPKAYSAKLGEVMAEYFDISDCPDKMKALKELSDELNELIHYLSKLRRGGGGAVPSSTFAYCTNSFDRLALMQKLDKMTEEPDGACIIQNAGVWVFPLLAAVTPPAVLGRIFYRRRAHVDFENGMAGDGMLADALDGLFRAEFAKRFPTVAFSQDKIDAVVCLKVANHLSDHLPLVVEIDFE